MSDHDVPIHSWTGDNRTVAIHKKDGLFGSVILCQIFSGSIGASNKDVDVRVYANALCEYLEGQRPKERENKTLDPR